MHCVLRIVHGGSRYFPMVMRQCSVQRIRASSLRVSLETFVSSSVYLVSYGASRSRTCCHDAEPCRAPYDLGRVVPWNEELQLMRITKAMEHFRTLYATARAVGAAKSILR